MNYYAFILINKYIFNNTLIYIMDILLYAFLILLMYFLAGFNKFANFSSTVKGFKNMFLFKNLPDAFYYLTIVGVIAVLYVGKKLVDKFFRRDK